MFSYWVNPEERIPKKHPLRQIKADVEKILLDMSPDFGALYPKLGRPSIPPETIMKSMLLMAFHSVRSNRQFCEQLDYNILFRWFLDMSIDEASFHHTAFSKMKTRLQDDSLALAFFNRVVDLAKKRGLMSDDHFTVDGTLIEAWASHKSFRPKDDSGDKPDDRGDRNFRGEKRTNETHQSTTDPEAKMMRKGPGKESRLSYSAHCLMENRNGLIAGMLVTEATRTESDAAEELIRKWTDERSPMKSVGADKGYHNKRCVSYLRELGIAPHVAIRQDRKTPGLDCRTTRHNGYKASQRRRKVVEEIFGWAKVIGGIRKSRFVGRVRTSLATLLVSAAYNLLRMTRLAAA